MRCHVVVEFGPLLRDVSLRRLHLRAFRELAYLPRAPPPSQMEVVAPLQQLRPGDVHRGLGHDRGRLHEADHSDVGRGGALVDPNPVADRDLPGLGDPRGLPGGGQCCILGSWVGSGYIGGQP